MNQINVPEGSHEAVLIEGQHPEMVHHWSEVMLHIERVVLATFGERRGFSIEEVVPTLVYAQVSRSAFMLCSAAKISGATFDPVEFGKRCEAIAREQAQIYQTLKETGGTA
jgi:hypothetical protein